MTLVGLSAKKKLGKYGILQTYCKSGIFCDNFIFAKSVKRHICDAKNSQLCHGLRMLVNDKSDFGTSQGFYFHETKTLAKISKFTVLVATFSKKSSFHGKIMEYEKPLNNLEKSRNFVK